MCSAATHDRRRGSASRLRTLLWLALLACSSLVGARRDDRHGDSLRKASHVESHRTHGHHSTERSHAAAGGTADASGHRHHNSDERSHRNEKHASRGTGRVSGSVQRSARDMMLGDGLLDKGYFNTLIVIFAVLVAVLSLVANIEMRIESKDEFVREAFDIGVKQVALMSLVVLSFYIILHTDAAATLEGLISKDPQHLRVFDALLQISFFLLCFFILFCGYIVFSVSRTIKFLQRSDDADVLTTAKEFDFVRGSALSFGHAVLDKTRYLVNRMEFVDALRQRGLADEGGSYFFNYLRASLIQTSMALLRVSRVSLLIALAALLVLRFIGPLRTLHVISTLTGLNTFGVLMLAWRVFHLESQLYPSELSQYLLLRLNVEDVGSTLQPYYRSLAQEYVPEGPLQRWLCGEGTANAHENLFWLKQNGPACLQKLFEALLFCHLMLLSIWSYCMKDQASLALQDYSSAAPLIATLLIVYIAPRVLYSLVVVTRCGNLIDFEVLDKVLASQRTENSKNSVQLIDALAMEAVRYQLEKGGDKQWQVLAAEQKALPDQVNRQLAAQWDALKDQHGRVSSHKLLKFMQTQLVGSGVCSKRQVKDFVKLFMRQDGKTLNFGEFMVLGSVVKNMILTPLDEKSLMLLFETRFEIPWKSPCGIDANNLDAILRKLNLKWNKVSQKHFLEFIGGGAIQGLSPEYMVQQLVSFQHACQKKYMNGS